MINGQLYRDMVISAANSIENEKEAISYILDVMSTNMLNEQDKNQLMEETEMLNPRYEYLITPPERSRFVLIRVDSCSRSKDTCIPFFEGIKTDFEIFLFI